MIDSWANVARRLALWTFLCGVSAVPSYVVATSEFDDQAMVVGVALFVVAYTVFTSTPWFRWFAARPGMRRTLYIGYGTRIVLSVIFPIGLWIDLFPGMISVGLAESLGVARNGFAGTLIATIVQGTLLNVILSFYMAIVYALLRPFVRSEERVAGFEVILPAEPIKPGPGQ